MSLRTRLLPAADCHIGQVWPSDNGAVIVGFDGSPGAERALRWAAGEAARRDSSLLVVHVFDWPWSAFASFPDAATVFAADAADLRESLEMELLSAAVTAHDLQPGVRVETALLEGVPGLVLSALAKQLEAAMVVLGPSTSGMLARMLRVTTVGTVTKQCCRPVTVVGTGEPESAAGTVVVGVTAAPESTDALAFAFEAAVERGSALRFAHAWPDEPGSDLFAPMTGVERQVYEWRLRYPQVPVERHYVLDNPASALTAMSADADLLVLGSGPGLVRASRYALRRGVRCPVVFLPGRPRRPTDDRAR